MCLALAAFALGGWLAGVPMLTTLGVGPLAAQPFTTLCFLLLSGSLLATLLGFVATGRVLLGIGAACIFLAPLQWLIGHPFGIERWLAEGPLAASRALPMRPTRPATVAELLLLTLSMMPPTGTGRRRARLALWSATVALLIATVLIALYLNGLPPAAAGNPWFAISLPGSAMSLALAVAVVAWRYRDGWPMLIAIGANERIAGGLRLPGLLAVLVLLQLLIDAAARAADIDPHTSGAIVLVTDIVTIAVLVGHASYHLAERRIERDEMASAVDHAAVIVVDRTNIIRHWSQGAEELYGWSKDEAIGRNRIELLRSEVRHPAGDWSDFVREGRWEGELVEHRRDGQMLHIHNIAKLLQHGPGALSAVNVVTDVSERRRAESERAKNASRLRAVIDVHELTVIEWNLNSRKIDWSINVDAMFGAVPDDDTEQIRQRMQEAIEPQVAQAIKDDLDEAIRATTDQFRRTISLVRPDGDKRIVDMAGLVVRDPEGNPIALISASNDMTDHYRREEAIRLGEARLAAAVAVQGTFIYEYDVVHRRMAWTTPGENFFGIDESASHPDWLLHRFPDLARKTAGAVATAMARHDDRLHFAFAFERADGARRQAESWARIVYDERGEALRVVGTHLDVTERTERETALRASEAEMRAVLATVPDAMIVCGADGIIRSCSASAETLFDCGKAGLVGTHILDLTNEDGNSRTALRRRLSQLFFARGPTALSETIVIHNRGGAVIPVSFIVGGATVEGQRMFVVFAQDMRADIEAEESFHKLQNDLAQVSRVGMMGEMAGALAHELSQPLAAIVNFLGAVELMIEAGAATERIGGAIHRAGEQASRAGEIVRRLRAFIERGEADMRSEPVTNVIREAAALALFNMSSLNVRLNYDFESETRMILGDRIQIQQVLVNLIRNGVDAMTGSGCLRREMLISTAMGEDNYLIVSVKDSGPGIGPEILDTLFKPFTTTKSEGLGFGLSISRRIIEAHGGTLTAETAGEGGAVFSFTLPIMDDVHDAVPA